MKPIRTFTRYRKEPLKKVLPQTEELGQKVLRAIAWGFSEVCLGITFVFVALTSMVVAVGSNLPTFEELENYSPPTISRVFSSEGKLVDEFARERRLFSPYEEIPDLVIHAVVSAEDKYFFQHRGLDPLGIIKAGIQAMQGERLRGASTITQQVMKNFLLSRERSVERKLKEILLAVKIEKALGKEKILELYLNEIFLGQNSYGITAAAQTYFNKSLDELSIEEAAYLAALPKAPSNYHPVRDRVRAMTRRNFVITEMVQNKHISEEEGSFAKLQSLKTVMNGDYPSFMQSLPPRSYFTDEIRRQLSREFGADEFFEGGLNIRATIDPQLQEIATSELRQSLEDYDHSVGTWIGTNQHIASSSQEGKEPFEVDLPRDIDGWSLAYVVRFEGNKAYLSIEGQPQEATGILDETSFQWVRSLNGARLPEGDRKADEFLREGEYVYVSPNKNDEGNIVSWDLHQLPVVQGAFIAMDTTTARVLTMVGGFSYQQSSFNRATQALRQPGSAFKPIVYASALDSGLTPASIIFDAPINLDTPQGIWRPVNYSNKFYGPVPLRTGIEQSRNLMTVRLANGIGLEKISRFAEKVGIYDAMPPFLANSLGAMETTLMKLVVSYAMFANGGFKVTPTLVDRVQDKNGNTIYKESLQVCGDCTNPILPKGEIPKVLSLSPQIIDPVTAYQITSMMQGVVERGTASRTVKADFPVAGKTGTTNNANDVWFIGYTSEIVAGCYIGYDDPRSMGKRATGGSLCAPVFSNFMNRAVEIYGNSDFMVPEGGVFVDINRFTGEPVHSGGKEEEGTVIAEFFRLGTEPLEGDLRVIDGGFPMASDLPVIKFEDWDEGIYQAVEVASETHNQDLNAPDTAPEKQDERGSFGSISAGGLY
ncbi:MAG: PBP1A family penicillin-binding protein [Rhodobacteraceae bacterium]|nr:PBP1A family penicillin-binding protein [Paracoccaceae bacterium]